MIFHIRLPSDRREARQCRFMALLHPAAGGFNNKILCVVSASPRLGGSNGTGRSAAGGIYKRKDRAALDLPGELIMHAVGVVQPHVVVVLELHQRFAEVLHPDFFRIRIVAEREHGRFPADALDVATHEALGQAGQL